MELKVIDERKGRFVFELPGATHTVCNVLKQELWGNKHVKIAGYSIKHPLIGTPEFVVETDGEDPRKIVKAACGKAEKELGKLADTLKKEVK